MVLTRRKFTFILPLCPAHTHPAPSPCNPGESVNKPRILASGSFLRSCVCWELSLGQAGGETLGIQLWCPCLPPPSWADRVLRIWISRHPPPAPHPRSLARWKGRMGQWLRTQTLQLDDFFFFLQLDDFEFKFEVHHFLVVSP